MKLHNFIIDSKLAGTALHCVTKPAINFCRNIICVVSMSTEMARLYCSNEMWNDSDLGPPVPLGASGYEKSPSSRSLTILQALCKLTPISSRSSLCVISNSSTFYFPNCALQYKPVLYNQIFATIR